MEIKDKKTKKTKYNIPMELFNDRKEKIQFIKREVGKFVQSTDIKQTIEIGLNRLNIKVKYKEFFVVGSKITFVFKIASGSKEGVSERELPIEKELAKSLGGFKYNIEIKSDGKIIKVILRSSEYNIPIDPIYLYKKAKLKHPTDIILGVDNEYNVKQLRLSENQHVLMSGMAGTGKTIAKEAMLISVMSHVSPEEVQLGIIDPKRENTKPFVNSPYMIANPVTEIKEILAFLNMIFEEIESRLKLFSEIDVVNMEQYKEKSKQILPYWIIAIEDYDELYYKNKGIYVTLRHILQNAHRVGIYFIISTQRYKSEYLHGVNEQLIKTRIAMQSINQEESKNIIGTNGAEWLNNNKDMLVRVNEEIENIQPHDLTLVELENICEYLKNKNRTV